MVFDVNDVKNKNYRYDLINIHKMIALYVITSVRVLHLAIAIIIIIHRVHRVYPNHKY